MLYTHKNLVRCYTGKKSRMQMYLQKGVNKKLYFGRKSICRQRVNAYLCVVYEKIEIDFAEHASFADCLLPVGGSHYYGSA